MAKIEKAYNLEIECELDAIEANELWLEKILTDKRAFQCKDPNCDAQITCNNMDKTKAQMKKTPYFKCYGEHSDRCQCINDYREVDENSKDRGPGRDVAYADNVDCFHLKRPEQHEGIRRRGEEKEKQESGQGTEEVKKKQVRFVQTSNHYSLAPIVSKYLTYGTHTAENHVRINGKDISYDTLFWPITRINEAILSPFRNVYFGKAQLNKKNEKYMVFFEDRISCVMVNEKNNQEDNVEETYSVICVIKKEVVNQYMFRNGKKQELEQAVQSNKVYDVYLYGKVNKGKGEKKTIFINIDNLDYIDIR